MKMKNKDSVFTELTPDLFTQILTDKRTEIIKLKDRKKILLKEIRKYLEELNSLKIEKKEIKMEIKIKKKNLRKDRISKFKINRKLSQQTKLAKDLNYVYAEEEFPMINVSQYYPEKTKTKKR